jgi:hypothetical protein
MSATMPTIRADWRPSARLRPTGLLAGDCVLRERFVDDDDRLGPDRLSAAVNARPLRIGDFSVAKVLRARDLKLRAPDIAGRRRFAGERKALRHT